MSDSQKMLTLQITAGQGPVECAWAVMRTFDKLREDAAQSSLKVSVIEIEPTPKPGTASSVLLSISGANSVDRFLHSWCGTVQWIAQSPFRANHKRRNWFVGIEAWESVDRITFDPKDIIWETMRASGPGGQHVNRTESAVRATHVPSGMQAVASEERSQHSNKKLALLRLAKKIENSRRQNEIAKREKRWRAQHDIERGNPVRIFRTND